MVDNSPYAYGYHVDNGIPIESWFDDENDTELLKLIGFLRRLHTVDDVRYLLRDHFKTFQLIENAGLINSTISNVMSTSTNNNNQNNNNQNSSTTTSTTTIKNHKKQR